MRWKVLISAPYMQLALERFLPVFADKQIEVLAPPVNERLDAEELMPWVGEIDGAICGDDRFSAEVLQAAPRLKVISKWGTGIDAIDREACDRLGIAVRNTPGAFSVPVAESVMGYMLCFARQLPWMDRAMKRGVWEKPVGRTLASCVVGVIGVGNVGKTVVRKARAWGVRVIGHDRVAMPEAFLSETGIAMVSKAALLQEADFVSLNCDLNPTSRHLMAAGEFKLMQPTSVVINTARGAIIDEPALVEALEGKGIAGAALDVFEDEPLPADSPLRRMDNVLLAPHNANSSPEAWERVHWASIENLLDVLETKKR